MFSNIGSKWKLIGVLTVVLLIGLCFVGGVSAEEPSANSLTTPTLTTTGDSDEMTAPTDGYMSIWLLVILFIAAVLMFVVSATVLYKGTVVAIVPMIASPIVCVILTAVAGLGKVGDITYVSGVVNNALVTNATVTLVSPAVVVILGLITGIMVILTIYISAQVFVNLTKAGSPEDENEGEY